MVRPAYVNHGRWVIDCVCGAGVLVGPGARVQCFECKRIHDVVFPPDWKAATAILMARPNPVNRNWVPSVEAAALLGLLEWETIEDLMRENAAHGVDS